MNLPVRIRIKQIEAKDLFESYSYNEVMSYCQHCSNYNQNHSCPDFSFDTEEMISSFDYATIILTEIDTDPIRSNMDSLHVANFSSRVLENYAIQQKDEISLPSTISMFAFEMIKNEMASRLLLMEQEVEPALSLPPGSCTKCAICGKRKGKPCTFPEQLRYSLEALGFLVSDIYKKHFDLELGWATGELPERFCTCSVLMTKANADEQWVASHFLDLSLKIERMETYNGI